jgi:hypothetical protein
MPIYKELILENGGGKQTWKKPSWMARFSPTERCLDRLPRLGLKNDP